MKKITLAILLLLSMLSFGQSVSVDVTELKVLNLTATTINFGTGVQSVNVSITASVTTSYNPNPSAEGSIAVYYKRNSNASAIIPTNGYDGQFKMLNGKTETKTFKITLNRSDFDDNGGVVYVQYGPPEGNLLYYKSSNINVTKLGDPISNNVISGNQTIYEGQSANTISGSTPSGGNGTFIYSWQQKIGNGSWTNISGAIGVNYSPGIPNTTTSYRRTVSSAAFTITGISNEVIVTVIPTPIIQNNIITLNGLTIEGSLPTGGIGANSYYYTWYIIDKDGDSSQLPDTSQSLSLTASAFATYLNSSNDFTIKRMVTSGSRYEPSNTLLLPHVSDIQNNIISLSGSLVTGSTPTGGIGNYTYSWAIYYTGDAIDFDETTQNLDLTPHLSQINTILQIDPSAKLVRLVTAGKSSTSNKLSLNSVTAKNASLKKESLVTTAVYPNPTSGSVNFITNFSSDKEIEIILYSEALGKTQSVFNGSVTPNQIVTWNISSNYKKGIYFYKIISNNEEIKSGKIIFQ